jgi:glycosyltransferase 2 family protein
MNIQKIKKYVSFSLKLIVTGLFFILILNKVDINSTFLILKTTNPSFFVAALSIMTIEVLIANIRWRLVLKQLNLNISFIKALRYLWIGVFFNQALPSSIGGDAVRGYYLCKKELYSLTEATFGVVFDRLIGLLGLVLLVIFTLPLIFDSVISLMTKWTILLVIISALLAISLSLLIDLIPNKLSQFKVINGLTKFSSKGRSVLFSYNGMLSIIISITIHLSFVYAAWLLAKSLSIDISLNEILLIVPITNLLIALPISIAGWGVREGLFIAGLGYMNVSADAALAFSILYGLLMLLVSIPGLVDWFLQKPKIED